MEESEKELILKYYETPFFKEYMGRSRYLREKILLANLNQGLILNGEDFQIINNFMKNHKVQEGLGFEAFIGYIINYYKINTFKDLEDFSKNN